MNKSNFSTSQILLQLFIVLPFIAAVILLIIGAETQKNISLLPPFNVNFIVVIITFLSFTLFVAFLAKWKNIDMGFAKLKPVKKIIFFLLVTIMFFTLSLLSVMSLKMNLNYWWRTDKFENIEITVEDKRISYGRGTDYYIEFSSEQGDFSNKVTNKNYDNFNIGETFIVSVYAGYFEGFYLTEEIK
ncbi:MAG: hypothetical protein AB8B72_01505 [Crocinitomicaceae bacterium]